MFLFPVLLPALCLSAGVPILKNTTGALSHQQERDRGEKKKKKKRAQHRAPPDEHQQTTRLITQTKFLLPVCDRKREKDEEICAQI